MDSYRRRFLIILFVFSAFLAGNSSISFGEGDNRITAGKANKKARMKDLMMEETTVKGAVEKPEFINIIKRRRVEFEDKGELNTSFYTTIYTPLLKHLFENNFPYKVNQLLDRGTVSK